MEMLKPPPPLKLQGNISESYKRFKQRFELYIKATKADERLENEGKIALLLHVMGEECIEIYNNFEFDPKTEKSYENVIQKFDSYFLPVKNESINRNLFFSRKIKENESFDEYVNVLRTMSMDCNFGTLRDSLIKDQIIRGIKRKNIIERLLKEQDLDLNKCIAVCKSYETAEKQIKDFDLEENRQQQQNVNLVKGKKENSDRRTAEREKQQPSTSSAQPSQKKYEYKQNNCHRCGYQHGFKCPAFNQKCKKCGKYGHYGKMCRNRVNLIEESSSSDESYVLGSIKIKAVKMLQWNLVFLGVLGWLVLEISSTAVQHLQLPASSDHPEVIQVNTQRHYHYKPRSIKIAGNDFILDGQKLQIVSGSLHYFRVPAEYWRDRLRKLKAAGLNSVSTYVEWSYHEPEERQYDFKGDRDLAQFIRLADEEGLFVLLRPGPYICAERDLGGLPYWLLGKYPTIRLRTTDENFVTETKIWMQKLFEEVTPLLYENGGPIILVQVENEYGSYGNDHVYMAAMRDIISSYVMSKAILYTTDGSPKSFFLGGRVNGTLTTIDFGSGYNVPATIKEFRKYIPDGPVMNSEYYPGWLTHWGEVFSRVDTTSVVKTLKDMLDNKMNINFYMFFGGSNFEFTSGANFGGTYQPDITSYDYDAPLNEAGDPTSKYYAIRETIKTYFPDVMNGTLPLPVPTPKASYGKIAVTPQIELLSREGRQVLGTPYKQYVGSTVPTFEHSRQRAGLVLYETTIAVNSAKNATLTINRPRDLIYVFVNGEYQGRLSYMYKQYNQVLYLKENSTLSLLVENQGRINFGSMLHDFKGILSPISLNGEILNGQWSITGFPLNKVDVEAQTNISRVGPVLYRGTFKLPIGAEPLDTFLDTTGWGKGYVWINGYNLGRYWPAVGPQVTLYVPGVWLVPQPAVNQVRILELENASPALMMESIDRAILDKHRNI